MQSFDSERNSSDGETVMTKPKQVRIKRAIWRYGEDDTYNNKPISETYFRDYYHEKLSMKAECEYCKSVICIQQMKRHQHAAKCLKFQNKNI
jgi:hypothetical protein